MKILPILLIAALSLGFSAHAEEPEYKLSTGFDFSSGDYGDDIDTDILFIPLTGKMSWFPLTFKLTVPWLQIEGPGDVVGGVDGGIVVGEGGTEVSKESGLGDLVASVMYSFDPWNEVAPYIDLTVKAKLPTADEDKFLGTGEADYSGQVDFAKSMGDFFPFLTLGYQVMGDNDSFDLDNRFYFSLGTSYKIDDTWSIGGIYDFKQASVSSSDDANELVGYVNWKINPEWSLNTYGVTGLTDGSPDFGIGSQLTRKF